MNTEQVQSLKWSGILKNEYS